MVVHPIEPFYRADSEVLILGSFPSVKSREEGFFYAHPQNRFWRLLAALFKAEIPRTIDDKEKLLADNHVALWDVIHSCEINGSSDSSITNVVVNDLSEILEKTHVTNIYVNGHKAYNLYKKYLEKRTGFSAECLPSTSPANAVMTFEELYDSWSRIIK